MKAAICDDEEIFITNFTSTLKKQKGINEVYGYSNPHALFADIEADHDFDIVFMDIRLSDNGKTGIEYAADICSISPKTQIIFVTGYNDYSQDIFQREINLCGFLLKTVEAEKLSYLIQKAEENIKIYNRNCLVVETKKATYAIPHKHITHVESKAHTIIIHTHKEDIVTYGKLDDIAALLPNSFAQCHKSYLVNMDYIARIEGYKLVLSNDISIPISRARYQHTYNGYFSYVKALM